jgi:hypothetical protein
VGRKTADALVSDGVDVTSADTTVRDFNVDVVLGERSRLVLDDLEVGPLLSRRHGVATEGIGVSHCDGQESV